MGGVQAVFTGFSRLGQAVGEHADKAHISHRPKAAVSDAMGVEKCPA